jgi:predicted branched-subunit amino acid permease
MTVCFGPPTWASMLAYFLGFLIPSLIIYFIYRKWKWNKVLFWILAVIIFVVIAFLVIALIFILTTSPCGGFRFPDEILN